MAWVAVGVAAVGVVGGVVASRNAASASDRASSRQAAAGQANLDFQMQQYTDWQDVYGPIQDNLSSFYQNLTSEGLIASGLQEYDIQHQQVNEDLKRTFAQRGIDTGAQDLLNMQNDIQTAEFKAKLRNDAPQVVASAQQGFLDHNATNPGAAGVSAAQQNQSNAFGRQADQFAANAATAYQGVNTALQGGINAYLQRPQTTQLVAQPAVQPQTTTQAPIWT